MLAEDSARIEAQLLERIASGDREAFAALYDRYSGPLFSFAIRIVGSPAEAEDVLQDVFVQIWEKAGQFDGSQGKPFSWSTAMTRNKAIDRLRSLQRRSRLIDEATNAAEPPSAQVETGNELNTDEATRVRSAVNSLPEEQKRAIELAFFGGKTHIEIAAILQEPLGTVKARIRRGMFRLREELEGIA